MNTTMPPDDNLGRAWVPLIGSSRDWPMESETQSYAGRRRALLQQPKLEEVVPHLQGQARKLAKDNAFAAGAFEKIGTK